MLALAGYLLYKNTKRMAPSVINAAPAGATANTAQVLGDYSYSKFATALPSMFAASPNPADIGGLDTSRVLPLSAAVGDLGAVSL